MDAVTSAHGAGIPPRRYAPPLPRGEFCLCVSVRLRQLRNPRPIFVLFPSWEGCRRSGGVVSRRTAPIHGTRVWARVIVSQKAKKSVIAKRREA
ncbi:MAG: hypothetical protein LBM98_07180 [Oscillospiraceae bacterium]|nr:hypothetical protein [Oscillospiraceae bacterium]